MQPPPKVILITPAYNEQETISIIVNSGLELLAKGIIQDFVVIDDGSTDRTAQIAKELGAKVISLPQNVGKGGAFLEGAAYCKINKADILIAIDADLTVSLKSVHITAMVEALESRDANMAIVPSYEGVYHEDVKTTLHSGQRAIRMAAIEFLFRQSNTGRMGFSSSKPAFRFRQIAKGYGLELALGSQISESRTRIVQFGRDEPLVFKPAYKDGRFEREQSDLNATRDMVEGRAIRLFRLRRIREKRQGKKLQSPPVQVAQRLVA